MIKTQTKLVFILRPFFFVHFLPTLQSFPQTRLEKQSAKYASQIRQYVK